MTGNNRKLILNFDRKAAMQKIKEKLKQLNITLPKKDKPEKLSCFVKRKILNKYLEKTYPLCFTNPISPLSHGIHKEIRAAGDLKQDGEILNGRKLQMFLYLYTNAKKYKKRIRAGAERKSLDGSVSGYVTEEEAKHAKKSIAEFDAKNTKRSKK